MEVVYMNNNEETILGFVRAIKKGIEIPAGKPKTDNLLDLYNSLVLQKETLKAKIFNLKGEYAAALPWGAFEQQNLSDLMKTVNSRLCILLIARIFILQTKQCLSLSMQLLKSISLILLFSAASWSMS